MRKLFILLVCFVSTAFAIDPPKPNAVVKPVFTMSKETTVILEPLDKDGYPDYQTALNLRVRGSIKPADNACVKLWQAFGPKSDKGKPYPDQYWKLLECEAPPEKGDYFIPALKYFRNQGQTELTEFDDDLVTRLDHEPWSTSDHPKYAKWLLAMEKPLNIAVEAVQRKSFFSPLVTGNGDSRAMFLGTQFPHLQKSRDICGALLTRAMLRTKMNQFEDAWKDIQACHRLARHIASGPGYIDMLVGIPIESLACRADVVFLEHAKPKGEMLVRCRNDLDALPPLPQVVEKMELGEHFGNLDIISHVRQGGIEILERLSIIDQKKYIKPEMNRVLDKMNWSDTFRTVNQWHERISKLMRITDRPTRMKAWKEYEDSFKTMKAELTAAMPQWDNDLRDGKDDGKMGETVGKILIVLISHSNRMMEEISERSTQTTSLTKLAFALSAYRESKGSYPDKLDQLVPTFVKTLPVDLYSGKSLIYRKVGNGYIIYSVGPNEKDDGGKLNTDEVEDYFQRGDDIGIRMPAKQP